MGEFGTLIKFGQLDHLLQLQNEGLIYMNCLPYFWEIEDGELRGDPFDCNARIDHGPKISIVLEDGREVFMEGVWTYGMHPPEPEKINLFCMYALRPLTEGTFPIDEGNFRFGEYALVLINRDEFMLRVGSVLTSQRIKAHADLVGYVDDCYRGELGPFRKLSKFKYQSEWRLVCRDGAGRPREIRIGSIRDISVIIRSDQVNKEIRVNFEQGASPDAAGGRGAGQADSAGKSREKNKGVKAPNIKL